MLLKLEGVWDWEGDEALCLNDHATGRTQRTNVSRLSGFADLGDAMNLPNVGSRTWTSARCLIPQDDG